MVLASSWVLNISQTDNSPFWFGRTATTPFHYSEVEHTTELSAFFSLIEKFQIPPQQCPKLICCVTILSMGFRIRHSPHWLAGRILTEHPWGLHDVYHTTCLMQMDNSSLGSEDFMEDHVNEKLLYCKAHTCVGWDLSGALDPGPKFSFIMFWMKSIADGFIWATGVIFAKWMVTRSKEHHTLQKKWLTWCLAIWPNCFNNTTFSSNMTTNYLKSGKICWLTHTIFTSADIIRVVSIASQFMERTIK